MIFCASDSLICYISNSNNNRIAKPTFKGRTTIQQIANQMHRHVGLKTLRKTTENRAHINAIAVIPRVLKVVLQPLTEGVWNLVKA